MSRLLLLRDSFRKWQPLKRNLCSKCFNKGDNSASIYLFKVKNRNTRKKCETCSKLIKNQNDPGVFIVNFEHILHTFF